MNERIKEIWEEATVSVWPRPGKFTAGEYDYHLVKFAELIRADEREACAKVCEKMEWDYWHSAEDQNNFTPIDCAEAIRAREETK